MLFGQKTHPANFEYGEKFSLQDDSVLISGNVFSAEISCDQMTDFCVRLRFNNSQVVDKYNYSDSIIPHYRQSQPIQPQLSQNRAVFPILGGYVEIYASRFRLEMGSGFQLETCDEGIGFNGEKFALNFSVENACGFYGFGERTKRLNKRGDSMDFWNVDVVAVFPYTYQRDDYDPSYVSIPFAIIKQGEQYGGIYFDNPGRAIIDIDNIRPGQLIYQSFAGCTDVYFFNGPTLRQVVQQFTQLTGRAAIPPLWSLGYHQCRWGYATEADFLALKDNFKQLDIPVSALWYDIDYMDGYRLFTWDKQDFPDPGQLNRALKKAGIHAVTIVDPGIKKESGYAVYESGKGLFCQTAQGKDYVGRVWPGDTVFPDFTQAATQTWWADKLATFINGSSIDGVWLDTNDPATGFSDPEDMRFAQGSVAHDRYHNQYGHFMAKASHQAFEKLDPDGRPFLLTRSACAGSQRFTAVWTGDNASNWRHLRMAIPATLNLGLSGIAFNGPDVGGFMGHTTAELLIRWYQTCFLFPFFRNHSVWDSKPQEPWQFGPTCLGIIRATIQTRYRLLPYLYNCFFSHYLTGDPVLRPLLYEYEDPQFENLDDQFLVGDSLMVAPVVNPKNQANQVSSIGKVGQTRYITFPEGWWFDLNRGEWLEGGKTLSYVVGLDAVPLFLRDGAIIPYHNGPINNASIDQNDLELHIFSKEKPAALKYFIDDKKTRAYQKGDYNTVLVTGTISHLKLHLDISESGGYPIGSIRFSPVLYGYKGKEKKNWKAVLNNRSNLKTKTFNLNPATRQWISQSLTVLA
jgi:alpha-glucosidase